MIYPFYKSNSNEAKNRQKTNLFEKFWVCRGCAIMQNVTMRFNAKPKTQSKQLFINVTGIDFPATRLTNFWHFLVHLCTFLSQALKIRVIIKRLSVWLQVLVSFFSAQMLENFVISYCIVFRLPLQYSCDNRRELVTVYARTMNIQATQWSKNTFWRS